MATNTHPSSPAVVPLAVWPVAQASAATQRKARGYHEGATAHPGKMLPALASRIVNEYSVPGALVLDPMCGVGTTLIEAAVSGRKALGVEIEPRWVEFARANIDRALAASDKRTRPPRVHLGDARDLQAVLGSKCGQADLIVISPPYACEAGVIDMSGWRAGRQLCPVDSLNYSTDRTNIGHSRGERYTAAMADVYASCYAALRVGGVLVTVTKNTRRAGRCFDLAGTTVQLAQGAGFRYIQHVVALLGPLRDSRVCARPSFWQFRQTRLAREAGAPAHLVVHEDVCVFLKPGGSR